MPSFERVAAVTAIPRTDILGVGISAIDMDGAWQAAEQWIDGDERQYVCFATVHSVMESHRDPDLRSVMNNAGITAADGMPLAWLGKLAGQTTSGRVCGPDFILEACKRSVGKGYRHYFYGAAPGVAERLAGSLQKLFPGMQVAGTMSPPFRSLTAEEDLDIVCAINRTRPDIVWVGLGAPKQERWMADHRGVLDARVLAGVGAAFDFHSGGSRKAPQWMQRAGLEWFFRLCQEPRRLWHRYLVLNSLFIVLLIRQHSRRLFSTHVSQRLRSRRPNQFDRSPTD